MRERPLTIQAFRFAIAPTPAQADFLSACCGASRFWFNQGLALVKERLDERDAGRNVDVPWSFYSLCVAFRGDTVKDQLAPWRHEVVAGSYLAGLEALGSALQKFSEGKRNGRRVGFPRFRRKGRCRESVIFSRPRIVDSRHVCLDKRRLGPIRTKESLRKLVRLIDRDAHARVRRSTVHRHNGEWIISFTVERSPKRRRAKRPQAAVGVDAGLTRLATLSTGMSAENSRPLRARLGKLRRLHRQLDRQRRVANPGNYLPDGSVRPGSRTWHKSARTVRTEERLRRVHRRVANLRREQAHQLTTYLTRKFGIIGIETLAIKNMMTNRRLARQIGDVGWGIILTQLEYKTSWSDGSMLVAADRFYPSSKTCSACGAVRAKLSLAERVFYCDNCQYAQDRDLNAALARMAQRHAHAKGFECYVAATGAETLNARGGQVSLEYVQHSPVRREDSLPESSRCGDVPALACRQADFSATDK